MILRLMVITGALLLWGCVDTAPPCQIQGQPLSIVGNAGCWVVKDQKVLMIKQRSGKYSFPGGTADLGESAQCTAHRETWEEAGADVAVAHVKRQFENGFVLFHCDVRGGDLKTNNSLEVSDVIWVSADEIPKQPWRFPEQKQLAIEWLGDQRTR